MKKISLILAIVMSLSLFANQLTHQMTPAEEARKDEIGRNFYETNPPTGMVRNIAEFEPMEGVLIRYSFGINYDVIAEMSENVMVTTVVTGQSQQNTVTASYQSNGVNLANCNFLYAASDSYWTRDYGQWYIATGGDVSIVNFPYNRPRPNDNDIPIEMANFLNIDLYGMDVIHTGGNYMTDGMGKSASTDLVWEEESQSQAQILQKMEDYLGITEYHVVADPNNTYIDHIDCWAKFLDVDKILIRSVSASHAQYDEIEAVVTYFANQTSSYGTPYEIHRVYTPQDQPYTNSLILNNKVLVPITGSSWDADALQTYEEAMPGYEVLGFTGSWESTDALHCRTKGVADREMLYIRHIPMEQNAPVGVAYEIEAELTSYSNEAINSATVYYKINGGNYTTIQMSEIGENIYSATIPAQTAGSEIAYYINAVDGSDDNFSHPFIGAPDPHIFYVGGPTPPELSVNPSELNVAITPNEMLTEIIELTNVGGGEINYNLNLIETTQSRNIYVTIVCDGGDWQSEISWEIATSSGTVIAVGGAPYNGSIILINGVYTVEAEDSYGDGWNGNYLIIADADGNEYLNYTLNSGSSGSTTFEIDVVDPISWVSVTPESGSLLTNETDEISVNFNSTGIENGTYTANLVIADDRRIETIIPLTMTVSNQQIIYGDVDGNGEVQAFDASLTLQNVVGMVDFTEAQTTVADVDGNGQIQAYDASLILQFVVGIINEFPVE